MSKIYLQKQLSKNYLTLREIKSLVIGSILNAQNMDLYIVTNDTKSDDILLQISGENAGYPYVLDEDSNYFTECKQETLIIK